MACQRVSDPTVDDSDTPARVCERNQELILHIVAISEERRAREANVQSRPSRVSVASPVDTKSHHPQKKSSSHKPNTFEVTQLVTCAAERVPSQSVAPSDDANSWRQSQNTNYPLPLRARLRPPRPLQ